MTIVWITVSVVFAAGIAALAASVLRAPQGYEDKDGFHHGQRPRQGH